MHKHTALFIVSLFPDGRRLIQPALFRSVGRPSALERVPRRSTYSCLLYTSPDFDSSFETYVCKDFVALETMSPLYGIEPGETIRHVENLSLFHTGSSVHPTDEDAIQKFIDNLGS